MQDERVSVGIREGRYVANAGVERLAVELHSLGLELRSRRRHVGHPQRHFVRRRLDPSPDRWGIPHGQSHLTGPVLGTAGRVALVLELEDLAVEVLCPLDVLDWNRDEVRVLDFHQPTLPSICSWIRRFISTAYSSGSSLVIGSTKPETIIELASCSVRPRLIR